MAIFDTVRPTATARQGLFSRIWAETFGAVAQWNDARLTRNALSKLSVQELDDIGLSRGDIEWMSERG